MERTKAAKDKIGKTVNKIYWWSLLIYWIDILIVHVCIMHILIVSWLVLLYTELSDYNDKKLTESNIGYKMLQKAGWKEGEGLGSNEDGIKAPIKQLVTIMAYYNTLHGINDL